MVVSTVRKEGKRHTAGPQRRGNSGNPAALSRGSAEHICGFMSMVSEERLWLLVDDLFSTRGPAEQACGLLGIEEKKQSETHCRPQRRGNSVSKLNNTMILLQEIDKGQ